MFLVQAHKHISEFEDQDDFDNAFYKLHRERNQTLLQFANVARTAYLKHDAYGPPLPDRTKGMIFLRQAKIPGHLEDHILAKTNGSQNFSDLLEAVQVLARRPMNQASSSYPSFNDDWTDSTYVIEYYDMDDHRDTEDGGYEDEYNEFEDYDGEWIDMSGIPENQTFEEPELACILENLQKAKRSLGRIIVKARRALAKASSETRRVAKATAPKTTGNPTRGTSKGRSRPHFAQVDDLLTRTRCFKCGELGHLARNCSQKKEDDSSLSSGDKDVVTGSEAFFSGMVCDDYNDEAVFAKKKETFLCDPNFEGKEETFLCDPNVEEKEETFLYHPSVSSEDLCEFSCRGVLDGS